MLNSSTLREGQAFGFHKPPAGAQKCSDPEAGFPLRGSPHCNNRHPFQSKGPSILPSTKRPLLLATYPVPISYLCLVSYCSSLKAPLGPDVFQEPFQSPLPQSSRLSEMPLLWHSFTHCAVFISIFSLEIQLPQLTELLEGSSCI